MKPEVKPESQAAGASADISAGTYTPTTAGVYRFEYSVSSALLTDANSSNDSSSYQLIVTNNPQILIKANIYMLLSHLACSDEPKNPMNKNQLLEFNSLIKHLPSMTASFANSGGIYLGKNFHFDLVRPGLALYGSVPGHLQNNLKNCISLYGRVLQLREVDKGQLIGYGGTYKLPKKARIATIGVGYADGYQRVLSGSSTVFHRGFPLPLVGRISMDSITVDISSLPDNNLKEGDFVELLGKHFTIDQAASLAQTVPYEMITGLGRRHYRYYNQVNDRL